MKRETEAQSYPEGSGRAARAWADEKQVAVDEAEGVLV